MIIYIDGTDTDCRDEAKGPSGEVKIFFNAVAADAVKSDAPTAATYAGNKITVTGVSGSSVQYTIDGTTWKDLRGNWNGITFTSVELADIPGELTNVKVRQKTGNKEYSDPFAVTAG